MHAEMTEATKSADAEDASSYPGAQFADPDERNLASCKFIGELFHTTRMDKRSPLKLLLCLIYSPIGLVLVVLRLFVFLPLVGFLSCLIPPFLRTAYCRFITLVFFGVHVHVTGKADPIAKVWTANHTSEMDALAIRCLANPHILGYSFYLQLWWLKFSPLSLLNMVYVPQRSRSEGNSNARDEIRTMVRDLLSKSSDPILVFPEGGLTSGQIGLLQYHMFMYSLDVPVQPIQITISKPPMAPVHIDYDNASFFWNVFWIAFVPFQSFNLTFLPSQIRLEGEEVLEFAQRAQREQAKALGIKATPFLYKDKGHWLSLRAAYAREGILLDLQLDLETGQVNVCNKRSASRGINGNDSPGVQTVIPVSTRHESSTGTRTGTGTDTSSGSGSGSTEETLKQRLIRDIHLKFGTTAAGFTHAAILPSQSTASGMLSRAAEEV